MSDTTFTLTCVDTFHLPAGEVPIEHEGVQTGRAFNFRYEDGKLVCDLEFFGFSGDILEPGITLDYLSFKQLRIGGPLVAEGQVLPEQLEDCVQPDHVVNG